MLLSPPKLNVVFSSPSPYPSSPSPESHVESSNPGARHAVPWLDPSSRYFQSDPRQQLAEFQAFWNRNHRTVNRDVAYLISGKSPNISWTPCASRRLTTAFGQPGTVRAPDVRSCIATNRTPAERSAP